MKIDFEQLIRIVAERYRFAITKDDPVLASVSLNEVVFEIHTNMLIEKMDEQNTRMITALQATLQNTKIEGKNDREKFMETVQAIHQRQLDDYRKIIGEHLETLKSHEPEIARSKNSAWLAMIAACAIAAMSICANVYIAAMR